MIQMPEIATAQQVADYLQVTIETVYTYAANEQFVPGVCVGKGRYNMDALRTALTTPPYRYLICVNKLDRRNDLSAIKLMRKFARSVNK